MAGAGVYVTLSLANHIYINLSIPLFASLIPVVFVLLISLELFTYPAPVVAPTMTDVVMRNLHVPILVLEGASDNSVPSLWCNTRK